MSGEMSLAAGRCGRESDAVEGSGVRLELVEALEYGRLGSIVAQRKAWRSLNEPHDAVHLRDDDET